MGEAARGGWGTAFECVLNQGEMQGCSSPVHAVPPLPPTPFPYPHPPLSLVPTTPSHTPAHAHTLTRPRPPPLQTARPSAASPGRRTAPAADTPCSAPAPRRGGGGAGRSPPSCSGRRPQTSRSRGWVPPAVATPGGRRGGGASLCCAIAAVHVHVQQAWAYMGMDVGAQATGRRVAADQGPLTHTPACRGLLQRRSAPTTMPAS